MDSRDRRLVGVDGNAALKKKKMDEGSASVAQMTIKAKIYDKCVKFRLPMSSGITELRQEVAKCFNRPAGTYIVAIESENYNINYKDEDGKFILLACDKDVQDCLQASKSLGNTTMVVFLELR